jgi:hypothetical protein
VSASVTRPVIDCANNPPIIINDTNRLRLFINVLLVFDL